jgi:hypothetical protein
MGDGNDEGDSRFSVPSPYSKLYGPNRVNVPISGMKNYKMKAYFQICIILVKYCKARGSDGI